MTLDHDGVLMRCANCGTTNRLRYTSLSHAMRCGKCRTAVPFPASPIDADSAILFDACIASASVPVVVDFWAAWCGPCRMMAPEIEKVAERSAGRALVLKVDSDANPELSQRYGIRSIPTVIVFQGGREAARASGVRPAAAIQDLLAPHAAA
jgi:thioredoxin 2